MILIIILLVLALQRYLDFGANRTRYPWFESYLRWMQTSFKKTPFWNNVGGVLLVIVPVLIVVALIQYLFNHVLWIFGITQFLFAFIVLFYCLDAYQLRPQLSAYLSALVKEDHLTTQEEGTKFVRPSTARNLDGSVSDLARTVTAEIFLKAEHRLFGVLFWFILLGPLGAIAYYLVAELYRMVMLPDSSFIELAPGAVKIFGLLDWLPARFVGLSYALIGSFVTGFNYWRKNFFTGIMATERFVIYSGLAALNIEHVDVIHADAEENEAALALIERALYLWIVAVAIFTLGGWL